MVCFHFVPSSAHLTRHFLGFYIAFRIIKYLRCFLFLRIFLFPSAPSLSKFIRIIFLIIFSGCNSVGRVSATSIICFYFFKLIFASLVRCFLATRFTLPQSPVSHCLMGVKAFGRLRYSALKTNLHQKGISSLSSTGAAGAVLARCAGAAVRGCCAGPLLFVRGSFP